MPNVNSFHIECNYCCKWKLYCFCSMYRFECYLSRKLAAIYLIIYSYCLTRTRDLFPCRGLTPLHCKKGKMGVDWQRCMWAEYLMVFLYEWDPMSSSWLCDLGNCLMQHRRWITDLRGPKVVHQWSSAEKTEHKQHHDTPWKTKTKVKK